ncbi:DNA primase [Paenibacillus pasadenensis]|uniref:DNA primase n=1 Tax=Paenibacillus pasadenensis TaxID=217090 RepID=A0A2N5N870_9BACL|nr:DNA primase [Paenibacillus pasadenensis]PLT46525.1 DNA primase [Paenibacillus pasadenensis]
MAYGKIPESVIEEVRRNHEIVDTVGKYVHLTKNGKYMKGLCPFHSERTPSFTVTPELQIFHCYGCGKGGNVIRFIEEIEGYSFPEAVRHLAEEAGMPITWDAPGEGSSPRDPELDKSYEAHELAAKFYHYLLNNSAQGQEARAYLLGRGMSGKLIDEFSIGFAPEGWDTLSRFLQSRGYEPELLEKAGLLSAKNDGSGYVDRFRARIMFPIRARDGKVCGFAGRVMDDSKPKYLNTPETRLFAKSKLLYQLHAARSVFRKKRSAVLFEGYMDVIKAWSAGVKNGVAAMGTALTDDHAAQLAREVDEVILCYDGDDAGQAAAMKSIPILEKAGVRALVAVLPKGMDPDEHITRFGAETFMREVIEHPVSVTKFKLLYSRRNHTLIGEEGRKNYVMEAVGIVAELDSRTEQEVYLKELSREFELSLESLKQDCHRIWSERQKTRPDRDKNDQSWNNGRNETRRAPSAARTDTTPLFKRAERHLLACMMHDKEVASTVYEQLGDSFILEDHVALAAYLYAYYAGGNEPDASRFISSIQDHRLEQLASSILIHEDSSSLHFELVPSNILDIKKESERMVLKQKIQVLKEEATRAEKAGDVLKAAQIHLDIIPLERAIDVLKSKDPK